MIVTIRYYAQLKEEAGRAVETVETGAKTVEGLWAEAASRHRFTLDPSLIRAAQADEFCPWGTPLIPNAVVVFMPPVAGG